MAHFRKSLFTGLAGLAVVVTGFACDGDDPIKSCAPPEAQGSLPEFTIIKGESLTRRVRQYFMDPDTDPEDLEYSATIADESVAKVQKIENNYDLTIDALEVGNTRITVIATDPCETADPRSAEQGADIKVGHPNRAPVRRVPIPDLEIPVDTVRDFNLRMNFHDPDGDVMTYVAESDNESAVTVPLQGEILLVTAVAPGTATIMVTATDPEGLFASDTAVITVPEGG